MTMIDHPLHEYVGSIHIHSSYSDGLRPIPEIAGIAEKKGLDFLLFADHMTLEPLKLGLERWYGQVLCVIGYEINDPDNLNHYLAYGIDDVLPPTLTAREYVRQVRDLGGTGFIAHPDEKRKAFPEHPPFPWTTWDAEGYDGIEIWNHSSEWLEKITHTNKYFRVLHPLKYLEGPEPETLERWDRMNRDGVMAGIGGTDAHAYPYRLGPITIYIFRYKVLFRGIRTHIITPRELPGDVAKAKKMVLDALKGARCFISNHRWGDARGFRFTAIRDGETSFTGDTVRGGEAEFFVRVPEESRIVLLRDGKKVHEVTGTELSLTTGTPGAYRVEVRKKDKPWIYSNHIRLQG